MKKTQWIILWILLIPSFSSYGEDSFHIDDYALLPAVRSLTISPNGKHLAYIQRKDNNDYMLVINTTSKKKVAIIDAEGVKARSIYFATNRHVILRTSKTTRDTHIRGQWENSAALSYNIKTKKIKHLLGRNTNLYPAQAGLGRIVGINLEKNEVYMPAFVGSIGGVLNSVPYHLMRVDLDSGYGRIHSKGSIFTDQWFVDDKGKVLARVDYNENAKEHRLYSKISGKWQKIYANKVDSPTVSFRAISHDSNSIIFVDDNDNTEKLYSLSLVDGKIEGPLFYKQDKSIDVVLIDELTNKFSGLKYSGFTPTYELLDSNVSSIYASLQNEFPNSSVSITSATPDNTSIVLLVSGNGGAGDYYLYSKQRNELTRLASRYPNIKSKDIAQIKEFTYMARDQLKIPAVITYPVDINERKNLPLIVMPHGGPESYDKIRFDWQAQYFARKGYLVLQPNFRGSSGFGTEHVSQGYGEWGRKMQDDVSDGVIALVKAGYADPDRVCIMGASYGGYSALAGGAFSSELYRCVIAINSVVDLPKLLSDTAGYDDNKRSRYYGYWKNFLLKGDEKRDLRTLSPNRYATNFKAPVLLIHSKKDTVVDIKHSQIMNSALKTKKKPVKFVKLKGDDHYLSFSETRSQMLKEVDDFLQRYNPVKISSP